MQVVDFAYKFRVGEVSSRLIDLVIPLLNPQEVTTRWADNCTWGKCEFTKQADGNFKPKVTIDTRGLEPGDYEDTLVVTRSVDHREFLIKFSVITPEFDNIPAPQPESINLPPRFVAVPDKGTLGKIDAGDPLTFETQVFNIGGPCWDEAKISWLGAPPLREFEILKTNNGQDFPIRIAVSFDTTKRSQNGWVHNCALRVLGGAVDLRIPIAYEVIPYTAPTLVFSAPKVFAETRFGSSTQVSIQITKTGSKPTKFEYQWENPDFIWHKALSVYPDDLITFPKSLNLGFGSEILSPGDYRDKILVTLDKNNYLIPVIFRVLPPE